MLIGTSIDAPSLGDHFGTLAVAVGLTVGEKSLSAPSPSWSAREVRDDRWGRVVSDSTFKWNFSIFRFE